MSEYPWWQDKIPRFLQVYYPFLDDAKAKNMLLTIELYEMICTEAIFVIEHKKIAAK